MKKFIRSIALVATATVAAGSLVAGLGGVAHAGTAPPWEPDASSVGGLAFFNTAGQQITGGNLTDSPIAAYVEGASTVRAGDQKATLYGYLPVAGTAPGTWSGEALGSSTTYPNTSAPAPLNTATLPVEEGATATFQPSMTTRGASPLRSDCAASIVMVLLSCGRRDT